MDYEIVDDEIGKLEKEIIYRDYTGYIRQYRNRWQQWRGIFVVIPKGNKLYEVDYDDLDYDDLNLNIPKEITYSEYGFTFGEYIPDKEIKTLKNSDWVLGIEFIDKKEKDLKGVEEELKSLIDEVIKAGAWWMIRLKDKKWYLQI